MDVPSDALVRLDAIRSRLPLSLRFEFDCERDIVLEETKTASSFVSLSVLMTKWQEIAEAEEREPGISHRVLAEIAELMSAKDTTVES